MRKRGDHCGVDQQGAAIGLRVDDREVEFDVSRGVDATPKQRSALKLVEGIAAVSAL